MSDGPVKPFVDYSGLSGGDSGAKDPSAIAPYQNGEKVNQAVLDRAPENLRERTEVVRDVMEDVLYLDDADRAHCLAGPGAVSWPGSTTAGHSGIPTISDDLYLVPFLTPGSAQTPPIPPVASNFGKLTLLETANAGNGHAGVVVQSLRRAYAGGAKISVVVVSGGLPGTCSAALVSETDGVAPGVPERTIVLTANAPTLTTVITALNAVVPPAPDNTALVSCSLATGASGTDVLTVPQAKQYVAGNVDGEGHAITPANLAAFFAGIPSPALAEGDSLCIAYSQMVDSTFAGVAGRRQSIPENSNTAVPSAAFFNSRLNPEKLVNALPICKVVNGTLVFIQGTVLQQGNTGISLGSAGPATPTALGTVELTYAAGAPAAPKVAPQDANGSISNVATGGGAPGFFGTGEGAGAGVVGQGGATDANGVQGTGTGFGAGGSFQGGPNGGDGVDATGGALGGAGVNGTGGTGGGPGGLFTGDTAGPGVKAFGGIGGGSGVDASGIGNAGAGVIARANGTTLTPPGGPALECLANPGENSNPTLLYAATARFKDTDGNVKGLFDHLGRRAGQFVEYNEWFNYIFSNNSTALTGATQPFTGSNTNLSITKAGTTGSQVFTNDADAVFRSPYVELGTHTAPAAGDGVTLWSSGKWAIASTDTNGVSYTIEFDVALTGTAANNGVDCFIGFVNLGSNVTGSLDFTSGAVGLSKRGGSVLNDTNWQLLTSDGSTTNRVNSGFAPTTGAQRIKIEYHTVNSPFGKRATLWLNGNPVTTTVNMPVGSLQFVVSCLGSSAGVIADSLMKVSPFRVSWNRVLSFPDA